MSISWQISEHHLSTQVTGVVSGGEVIRTNYPGDKRIILHDADDRHSNTLADSLDPYVGAGYSSNCQSLVSFDINPDKLSRAVVNRVAGLKFRLAAAIKLLERRVSTVCLPTS